MKRLLMVLAVTLCGCQSLTPEKISAWASLAGAAANLGAQAWLMAHPEHQQAFDLTTQALSEFLSKQDAVSIQNPTNQAKFIERISSLPTPTLASDGSSAPPSKGEVYVSNHLVLYDKGNGKAVKVEGAAVLPVFRSVTRGLKEGTRTKRNAPHDPTLIRRPNVVIPPFP